MGKNKKKSSINDRVFVFFFACFVYKAKHSFYFPERQRKWVKSPTLFNFPPSPKKKPRVGSINSMLISRHTNKRIAEMNFYFSRSVWRRKSILKRKIVHLFSGESRRSLSVMEMEREQFILFFFFGKTLNYLQDICMCVSLIFLLLIFFFIIICRLRNFFWEFSSRRPARSLGIESLVKNVIFFHDTELSFFSFLPFRKKNFLFLK